MVILLTSLASRSYSSIRRSFSWLTFKTLQILLAAVSAYKENGTSVTHTNLYLAEHTEKGINWDSYHVEHLSIPNFLTALGTAVLKFQIQLQVPLLVACNLCEISLLC